MRELPPQRDRSRGGSVRDERPRGSRGHLPRLSPGAPRADGPRAPRLRDDDRHHRARLPGLPRGRGAPVRTQPARASRLRGGHGNRGVSLHFPRRAGHARRGAPSRGGAARLRTRSRGSRGPETTVSGLSRLSRHRTAERRRLDRDLHGLPQPSFHLDFARPGAGHLRAMPHGPRPRPEGDLQRVETRRSSSRRSATS